MIIGFIGGSKIAKGEIIGFFVAIFGCMMIMTDPSAQRVTVKYTHDQILFADGIDLIAAMFGAFYFLLSAKLVKDIPICSFIFFQNLHFLLINLALACLKILGDGPPF